MHGTAVNKLSLISAKFRLDATQNERSVQRLHHQRRKTRKQRRLMKIKMKRDLIFCGILLLSFIRSHSSQSIKMLPLPPSPLSYPVGQCQGAWFIFHSDCTGSPIPFGTSVASCTAFTPQMDITFKISSCYATTVDINVFLNHQCADSSFTMVTANNGACTNFEYGSISITCNCCITPS